MTAPLSVTVEGREHECSVDNVSAGGVRLAPPLDLESGQPVTIVHPKSGLSLEGKVVATDAAGTRVQF